MENETQPRKAFVIQVVTVIHTCHSHNIPAAKKRLDAASRLFSSICEYDSLYDSLIRETVDEIFGKLSKLRYVEQSDEAEITRIKSDCLVSARRLHQVANRMKLRDADALAAELPLGHSRAHAFGWMQAAG